MLLLTTYSEASDSDKYIALIIRITREKRVRSIKNH